MLIRTCHHGHLSDSNGFQKSTEISDYKIIKKLYSYIWPHDRPHIKRRVVLSMGLLAGSKLANIQIPFIFKYGIDYLNNSEVLLNNSLALTTAVAIMGGCKCHLLFLNLTRINP